MTDTSKPSGNINRLLDDLEQELLSMPSNELQEEMKEEGEEIEVIASTVQQVIANEIKRHKQQKLHAARENYERAIEGSKSIVEIPDSPNDRRDLLMTIIAQQSQIPQSLTLKFREGGEMDDEDISSLLEDLAQLGLLSSTKR